MSNAGKLFESARRAFNERRDLDARLYVAAGLSLLCKGTGGTPVIVGGTAVDIYAAQTTERGLAPSRELRGSLDVDVITLGAYGQHRQVRKTLAASADFDSDNKKVNDNDQRKWWLRGTGLLVEILGGELAGDPERVTLLDVEGAEVAVWGIEDTIWNYAQSGLATHNRSQWERAQVLTRVQAKDIDWEYLQTLPEGVEPAALVDCLRDGADYEAMLRRCG